MSPPGAPPLRRRAGRLRSEGSPRPGRPDGPAAPEAAFRAGALRGLAGLPRALGDVPGLPAVQPCPGAVLGPQHHGTPLLCASTGGFFTPGHFAARLAPKSNGEKPFREGKMQAGLRSGGRDSPEIRNRTPGRRRCGRGAPKLRLDVGSEPFLGKNGCCPSLQIRGSDSYSLSCSLCQLTVKGVEMNYFSLHGNLYADVGYEEAGNVSIRPVTSPRVGLESSRSRWSRW